MINPMPEIPNSDAGVIRLMKAAEAAHAQQRARELHACERCRTVFRGEVDPALVLYPGTRIELEAEGRVVASGNASAVMYCSAEIVKHLERKADVARSEGSLVGTATTGVSILSVFTVFDVLARVIDTPRVSGLWMVIGYAGLAGVAWGFVPLARPGLRITLCHTTAALIGSGALWAFAADSAHPSMVAGFGAVFVALAVAALLYMWRRS